MASRKKEFAPNNDTFTDEPKADVAIQEPERKPFPPLRSHEHDNVAGVERSTYSSKEHNIFESRIQFRDGKPSEEVRKILKSNGFSWVNQTEPGPNFGQEGAWVKPFTFNTRGQDTLVAERTYRSVADLIRQEKGLEPEKSRF